MLTEHEGWQVSDAAAELYENFWVPAMLGQWAPQLVDAVGVAGEDRVLDVACGTGVVAREAARRVAAPSQVTGLDLNQGMLAVARRSQPAIVWRHGDATELPFDDASYDVVTCQFALMYLPDRPAALREMRRVLAPGGRLGIAVWGPYERATGYVRLTEIARRHCGSAAVNVLTAPFILGEEAELRQLFRSAGIDEVDIDLRDGTVTFASIDEFIEMEVKGTPLGDLLDAESYDALLREAREELQGFTVAGEVVVPMDANIVTARNA